MPSLKSSLLHRADLSAKGFTFRRPLSLDVRRPDTDPYAAEPISRLAAVCARKCLEEDFSLAVPAPAGSGAGGRTAARNGAGAADGESGAAATAKINPLQLPLEEWVGKAGSSTGQYTFGDLLDKAGDTALLYEVQELLSAGTAPSNAAVVLGEASILEYLFARAKYTMKLGSAAAIHKWMTSEEEGGGTRIAYEYVVKEAVLRVVKDSKLEVGSHQDIQDAVQPKLRGAGVSFRSGVFADRLEKSIRQHVYSKDEYALVAAAKDQLNIADEDVPALVSYIKKSKVPIDADNATYFLAIALDNLRNDNLSYPELSADSPMASDGDFSVTYYDEEQGTLQIVRENVLCAAQLYYVMTIADEMEVFNVANFLTSQSGGSELRLSNRALIHDLQDYIFSKKFRSLSRAGEYYERTHPEDRRMFYRQVFNLGSDGSEGDGAVVNTDFSYLWETLLTETAKYLSKIQQSESPLNYVSRQTVFQAIEDLQYNLSSACQGMVKVMGPVIRKELDFVIERILKSKEVAGTYSADDPPRFLSVVEAVQLQRQRTMPRAAQTVQRPPVMALYNKARFGHAILEMVANYTPTVFNDDATFSGFVSTVEAFIIASSQLEGGGRMQEEGPGYGAPSFGDEESDDDQTGMTGGYGAGGQNGNGHSYMPPGMNRNGTARNGAQRNGTPVPAGGEWDF